MMILEKRLEKELLNPIKKFGGTNNIRMCGRHNRCFMGHHPKAILLTALMINLPVTFFNIAIASASLWNKNTRAMLVFLGIILQIACTVLMLCTSVTDPGIIPATHISRRARHHIDKKYL